MEFTNRFMKDCKAGGLWYKDESGEYSLKYLFEKHNMQNLYEKKIVPIDMYRWYPEEVFNALVK